MRMRLNLIYTQDEEGKTVGHVVQTNGTMACRCRIQNRKKQTIHEYVPWPSPNYALCERSGVAVQKMVAQLTAWGEEVGA